MRPLRVQLLEDVNAPGGCISDVVNGTGLYKNRTVFSDAIGKISARGLAFFQNISTHSALVTIAANVILTVTDTGCGISTEEQALWFERFYRADKSRARASGAHSLRRDLPMPALRAFATSWKTRSHTTLVDAVFANWEDLAERLP